MPLKHYFLAGINAQLLQNIPEEKYVAPLRILNLFIKPFVNSIVDFSLTFLIVHLIHFHLNQPFFLQK